MKRIFIFSLLLFFMFVSSVGCGKIYEIPHDQFCIYTGETEGLSMEISLSLSEKKDIIQILNNGKWANKLTNCACNFKFYTQKQTVAYHTECGTFNDYTNQKSMIVSEEQRQKINAILEKYV